MHNRLKFLIKKKKNKVSDYLKPDKQVNLVYLKNFNNLNFKLYCWIDYTKKVKLGNIKIPKTY